MCNIGQLLTGNSGPSQAEKSAGKRSATMAQTLDNNYATEFQNQNDMLQLLQGETRKIETGQTGEGFSPAEEAARESLIENNAAAGERNARQASQNESAGLGRSMGGDSSGLQRAAGIRQQVAGEIATAGENNKSNALLANTAANYNQGRTNANEAAGLYGSLAGRYGSAADAAMTGGANANNAAFSQAQQITKEQDAASPWSAVGGLIQKGVGLATGGGFGGLLSSLSGGKMGPGNYSDEGPAGYGSENPNNWINVSPELSNLPLTRG